MRVPEFPTVYGVDFCGARLAERFFWIARLERVRKRVTAAVGLAVSRPQIDHRSVARYPQ